jgi:drug/metabolite transporter (DMT)-like permease
MDDLPPEDLLDHRGRLNRLVIALAVGVAVGAGAYFAIYSVAGEDYERGVRGAGRLVFMVTGLAFAATFSLVHWGLKRRDLKKWKHERIPKAEIR